MRLAAVAIVTLALGLRLWGLHQGLPFAMSRPDEVEALRQTAWFPTGDLNPRWFVYPNLFFWIIWLWLEGTLALRRLVGDVPAYAQVVASQMPLLIADGRLLSALVGTATVAVVMAIGRRLGGVALALVAGALLAVHYLHVRDSHALKADVFLAFAVPICCWLLARWATSGTTRDAAVAGTAIGIATGFKYPGILLGVGALVADRWARSRAGVVPSRGFWIVFATAAAVFMATSPFLLLHTGELATTFTNSVRLVYGAGRPGSVVAESPSLVAEAWAWLQNRTFAYHLLVSLRWGSGIAVALCVPVALVHAWRRGGHPFWSIAIAFVLAYYFVISLSQVTLARYFTPLAPVVALLVGRLVVDVGARLPSPAVATAVLVVLLGAEPLARSVAHDRVAAQTDTRVLATQWMAEHLPDDAVVAVLGTRVWQISDPDVPPPRRKAPLGIGTDFDGLGVTHVVVHEHPLPFSQPIPQQLAAIAGRTEPLAEFSPFTDAPAGWFEELDAYYIPFHDFAGVERPGPHVRILRLRPPGGGTTG